MINQSRAVSAPRPTYIDCFKHFYTSIRFWGNAVIRYCHGRYGFRSAMLSLERPASGIRFVTSAQKPKSIPGQSFVWAKTIPPLNNASAPRDPCRALSNVAQGVAASALRASFPSRKYLDAY